MAFACATASPAVIFAGRLRTNAAFEVFFTPSSWRPSRSPVVVSAGTHGFEDWTVRSTRARASDSWPLRGRLVEVDAVQWQTSFDAFLVRPDPWEFLASWAREATCLPVYCDWTHAFGVRADGTMLAFEHDPKPGCSPERRVVTDLRELNIALREGTKRYPWLEALLPPRPTDAQDCSMCSGTGRVPEPLICYCGGAGWVPASDTWVNRDRFVR